MNITGWLVLVALIGLVVFLPIICSRQESVAVPILTYDWAIYLIMPDGSKNEALTIEDEFLAITIEPFIEFSGDVVWKQNKYARNNSNAGFAYADIVISNKSDHSVKLIWDESAIILPDGKSSSIAPGDLRCIKAGLRESLLPMIIPPNTMAVRSSIFAVNQIEGVCDLRGAELNPDGSVIRLFLALDANSQRMNYAFDLSFSRVSLETQQHRNQCVERVNLWRFLTAI